MSINVLKKLKDNNGVFTALERKVSYCTRRVCHQYQLLVNSTFTLEEIKKCISCFFVGIWKRIDKLALTAGDHISAPQDQGKRLNFTFAFEQVNGRFKMCSVARERLYVTAAAVYVISTVGGVAC